MRCSDYDDPEKIIDETAEEYLCEYCSMRTFGECDGKGNMQVSWENSLARQVLLLMDELTHKVCRITNQSAEKYNG